MSLIIVHYARQAVRQNFASFFDTSCPTTSGKSLNNLLMVGPTIQPELFNWLIHFRLFKFALTADIVKMYRQVLVDS